MAPLKENGSVTHIVGNHYDDKFESLAKQKGQVTVTLNRDELWDMIAYSFDKADSTDFDDDADAGDYADYYWCVTDDLFERMKKHGS